MELRNRFPEARENDCPEVIIWKSGNAFLGARPKSAEWGHPAGHDDTHAPDPIIWVFRVQIEDLHPQIVVHGGIGEAARIRGTDQRTRQAALEPV